jgi:hypothetical protein
MEIYKGIRQKQENIINDNPTSITITRTTKASDGAGGWTESTTTLDAQTVRLYTKGTVSEITSTDVAESGYTQVTILKMLAEYDADVERKTADNTDTFTANGRNYEIVDVLDVMVGGEIVFKQCQVREV